MHARDGGAYDEKSVFLLWRGNRTVEGVFFYMYLDFGSEVMRVNKSFQVHNMMDKGSIPVFHI